MKPIDYVLGQPWAMTHQAIEAVVSIVERTNQDPSAVETQLGRPLDNAQLARVTDGVAVIPVVGPIARYANIFTRISGATSIDVLARDFRVAMEDPKVKAVVLDIDSPGGTVNGTSEFAAQVLAARGTKPVVAYAGNDCCSGAYWIASACSEIVAVDTAHLGSIGVVSGYPRKTAGGPHTEFVSSRARNKRPDISTEEGRAVVQAHVDDIEDVFVSTVARYRGVPEDTVVSDFGQGDHLIASKAIAAGMADRLGSLDGLVAELSSGAWKAPAPKPTPSPTPTPKPAPQKAETHPRRAAMSEPIESISAAEAAELRQQVAALQARAEEAGAIKERLAAVELANATLSASNKSLHDDRIVTAARIFAENEVRAGRASVPEREAIVSMYVQAARDDAEHPAEIAYAVAGRPLKGTRCDALKASHESRPVVTLGRQLAINAAVGAPSTLPPGYHAFAGDDHADPAALSDDDKKRLDALAAGA